MLSNDQSHGLKHIIDIFDRYPWKFQYEKRQEIKDCLHNLWQVDAMIKTLRHEDEDIIFEMRNVDPEHPRNFMASAAKIIPRIIYLMEKEDKEITRLNHAFSEHEMEEVRSDKKEIEEDEESEESHAKKLERWAKKMIETVKKVSKKHKEERLNILIRRLKQVMKDMRWFEKTVEAEERIVENSKEEGEL